MAISDKLFKGPFTPSDPQSGVTRFLTLKSLGPVYTCDWFTTNIYLLYHLAIVDGWKNIKYKGGLTRFDVVSTIHFEIMEPILNVNADTFKVCSHQINEAAFPCVDSLEWVAKHENLLMT